MMNLERPLYDKQGAWVFYNNAQISKVRVTIVHKFETWARQTFVLACECLFGPV